MRDVVIKSLERDRKRAVKAYGEKVVLSCLSEKTGYPDLCEIYAALQGDISDKHHLEEAKWLKGVIEKTILSKVMEEHGYSANGNKLNGNK